VHAQGRHVQGNPHLSDIPKDPGFLPLAAHSLDHGEASCTVGSLSASAIQRAGSRVMSTNCWNSEGFDVMEASKRAGLMGPQRGHWKRPLREGSGVNKLIMNNF